MNLTLGDVAELPLAAALLDGEEVVARTPEWNGAGPGTVAYRVRSVRLAVNVDPVPPWCASNLEQLLRELDDAAAQAVPPASLRLRMLACALRVLAGRVPGPPGTTDDVLEQAAAGIRGRTGLATEVVRAHLAAVEAASALALVLVQLAVNAERHAGVTECALRAAPGRLAVEWQGEERVTVRSVRRRADRQRWGLGFATIAADAAGAGLHPPVPRGDGRMEAIVEPGVERLALPLAGIRDGCVARSTRAWDDETGLLPGAPVTTDRLRECIARAGAARGQTVVVEGWHARRGHALTWVAVPPDGVADRARDVLDGLVHERGLWAGTDEPGRSRIAGRSLLLAAALGSPVPAVIAESWNRQVPALRAAHRLSMPVPEFTGMAVMDPRAALLLASEVGDRFEADGDSLWLRLLPGGPVGLAGLEIVGGRVRLG